MPDPEFVSCPCNHCGGHIEFSARDLTMENRNVTCPHCAATTTLSVPGAASRPGVPRPEVTPSSQAQDWGSGPATPKQVAFLTYMGMARAGQLTKKEASDLIDSGGFLPEVSNMAAWERQQALKNSWQTERLFLYPQLYQAELEEHLNERLPELLHSFVRCRVVGASKKLTKAKIREVITSLTSEAPSWWHHERRDDIFCAMLKQMYPGCCDGRPPEPATSSVRKSLHPSPRAAAGAPLVGPPRKAGCLLVLSSWLLCTGALSLLALLIWR